MSVKKAADLRSGDVKVWQRTIVAVELRADEVTVTYDDGGTESMNPGDGVTVADPPVPATMPAGGTTLTGTKTVKK